MTQKIIYPRDKSKITNPDVKIRWDSYPKATSYLLEIFQAPVGPSKIKWSQLLRDIVSDTTYPIRLTPGYQYYCQVTPVFSNVIPPTGPGFRGPGKTPGGRKRTPPPPDTSGRVVIQPAVSSFYVKSPVDYLLKYMTRKKESLKPRERFKSIIPMFFFHLERYLHPEAPNRTELDEAFKKALDTISPENRTTERLNKVVNHYDNIPRVIKEKFSLDGTLPRDRSDTAWAFKALEQMFGDDPLLKALKAAGQCLKRMDLEFKYPVGFETVRNLALRDNIRIPVSDSLIGTGDQQLRLGGTYLLRVIAGNDESREVQLELKEFSSPKPRVGRRYALTGSGKQLAFLDSARFRAQLIEVTFDSRGMGIEKKVLWEGGILTIKGGKPTILRVEPNSVNEQSATAVLVSVRDAGDLKSLHEYKVILEGGPYSARLTIPENGSINCSEQTLQHQVFTFTLADSPGTKAGVYDLYFMSSEKSVNSFKFYVELAAFRVTVRELHCQDVSDPELWNDSISYILLANTSHFIRNPVRSGTYEFDTGDHYYGYQEPMLRPEDVALYGPRIIEDFLAIHITICEHDDLDWLAWVLDELIDFVQSWLAHLVDAFTFGLGGFIILACIEVSGLNDMREQAIDSIVAGWEVEILHEGILNIDPFFDITLSNQESTYFISFEKTLVEG